MPELPTLDEVYRACVDRLTDVVDLSETDLSATVPACPAWTVHELVAHLAGASADNLSGRMDGAVGPPWSERHVAERRNRPVAELVTELRANSEEVAALCASSRGPSPAWDIAVHECDLAEALDRPVPPRAQWEPVLLKGIQAASGKLQGGPDVLVQADDLRLATGGSPVVSASTTPYELFRAVFSRRSSGQLEKWSWSGEAGPVIEQLGLFGPRSDDQPQPAGT